MTLTRLNPLPNVFFVKLLIDVVFLLFTTNSSTSVFELIFVLRPSIIFVFFIIAGRYLVEKLTICVDFFFCEVNRRYSVVFKSVAKRRIL